MRTISTKILPLGVSRLAAMRRSRSSVVLAIGGRIADWLRKEFHHDLLDTPTESELAAGKGKPGTRGKVYELLMR